MKEEQNDNDDIFFGLLRFAAFAFFDRRERKRAQKRASAAREEPLLTQREEPLLTEIGVGGEKLLQNTVISG